MKRSEFQDLITKKAWSDPDFKKRLLEDPRAVMSEELGKVQEGVSIPDSIEVSIVEETPGHICLVLPVNPADITGTAVSEEDLAKVAGGQSTSEQTSAQVSAVATLDVAQSAAAAAEVTIVVTVQ